MNESLTKEDILNIAKNQALFCWAFFASLIIKGLAMFVHTRPPAFVMGLFVVQMFIFINMVIFMYRLLKALKTPRIWLWIIGLFLPLINLLVLIQSFYRASKELQSRQIKVGLMGAHAKSLQAFMESR